MRKFVAALFAGLFITIPPTEAHAGESLNQALGFVCEGTTCVIDRNMGGYLVVFQAAAREVLLEGKLLIINGECRSGCAILADMARSNTCVTPQARFGFHKAYQLVEVSGRVEQVPVYDPPHSSDIHHWVMEQGGYPNPGDGHRWMLFPDTSIFWRIC